MIASVCLICLIIIFVRLGIVIESEDCYAGRNQNVQWRLERAVSGMIHGKCHGATVEC